MGNLKKKKEKKSQPKKEKECQGLGFRENGAMVLHYKIMFWALAGVAQ